MFGSPIDVQSKLPPAESYEEAVQIRDWLNARCAAKKHYEDYLKSVKDRLTSPDDISSIDDATRYTQNKFNDLFLLLQAARNRVNTEQQKRQQQPKRDMSPEIGTSSSPRPKNKFLGK
jgi:hypothetical protein